MKKTILFAISVSCSLYLYAQVQSTPQLDKQRRNIVLNSICNAGNGGLDWNKVKLILEKYLSDLDCDIHIYEPNAVIQEVLKRERVKLTPAALFRMPKLTYMIF